MQVHLLIVHIVPWCEEYLSVRNDPLLAFLFSFQHFWKKLNNMNATEKHCLSADDGSVVLPLPPLVIVTFCFWHRFVLRCHFLSCCRLLAWRQPLLLLKATYSVVIWSKKPHSFSYPQHDGKIPGSHASMVRGWWVVFMCAVIKSKTDCCSFFADRELLKRASVLA